MKARKRRISFSKNSRHFCSHTIYMAHTYLSAISKFCINGGGGRPNRPWTRLNWRDVFPGSGSSLSRRLESRRCCSSMLVSDGQRLVLPCSGSFVQFLLLLAIFFLFVVSATINLRTIKSLLLLPFSLNLRFGRRCCSRNSPRNACVKHWRVKTTPDMRV